MLPTGTCFSPLSGLKFHIHFKNSAKIKSSDFLQKNICATEASSQILIK